MAGRRAGWERTLRQYSEEVAYISLLVVATFFARNRPLTPSSLLRRR